MIELDSTTQAYACGQTAKWENRQTFEERQVVGQETCRSLAAAASNAAASMPNLSTFIILDAESSYDRPLGVDMLRVRDVIRNQTTTFPLFKVDMSRDKDALIARNVLRKLPDVDAGNDIVGNIAAVEVYAKGGVWGNTTSGSRLPICLKNEPEAHRHHWSSELPYMTKEQFLGLPELLNVKFWSMEKKAGKQLVQARIQDGVVDLEPLVRDTYESPPPSGDDEDVFDESDLESGYGDPDF
ncbi:uncharacterized protein AB675_4328 [Cyphellophora attinorum]|uniref:Uncharacterized protein n=1 Tax=Cyphellophora attinorum TaxID=1664694 RepID=A0A0N1NZ04_9EURO|nr:uncharacterized protein AB675_4328 [Phialophora attinorum]KPI36557.1 hypothetical protein AB675_4328 [Phialophora attinorum]